MAQSYPRIVAKFGISEELDDALDSLVAMSGTSRTFVLRTALSEYLRSAGVLVLDDPRPEPMGRRRVKPLPKENAR